MLTTWLYILTASDAFGFCLVTREVVTGVWAAVATLPIIYPDCTLWHSYLFHLKIPPALHGCFSEKPRKSLMKDYFMIWEWKLCWYPTVTFSEHLWNFSQASGKRWIIFLEMQNKTVMKSNCEARSHRLHHSPCDFSSVWLLTFNFLVLDFPHQWNGDCTWGQHINAKWISTHACIPRPVRDTLKVCYHT